jgi:hypothetical protein
MARRIRAPIVDLSEYGKRYKGKNVTRKEILVENSEDEEEDGSIEDEEEDDDDENDAEEDGSMEDDDDDQSEEDDEKVLSKSTKTTVKAKDADKNGFSLINLNHNEEIAKGKAVKNQLSNRF